MDRLRVLTSCLVIGMVVMLTVNFDLVKKMTDGLNDDGFISKVLQRTKRATSDKPMFVRGGCGGQLYGRTGWIASPNFPGSSYPSLSSCNWTIAVYPQMVIKFEFVYIDMDDAPQQKGGSCRSDFVEIREGKLSTDPLVGDQRYCGYDTPFNPAYSSGNRAWVYFSANGVNKNRQGFAIRWTAVDPPASQFNCDFESVNGPCIGWKQSTEDDFDWTAHHGQTKSGKITSTGPLHDHTLGTLVGTYIYIEASGRRKGERAILTTPTVWIRNPNGYCFRFWYHMRGETMGTLHVKKEYVVNSLNNTSELIFNQTGNLGLRWKRAMINITASEHRVKFHFEGIRGSSYKGDMAIDDVKLSPGPCATPIITTTTPIPTSPKRFTTRKPKTTTRRTTRPTTTTTTTTVSTNPAEKCAGQYTCRLEGNCVDFEWFCDGIVDCLEKDDEENCDGPNVTTTQPPPSKTWNSWGPWTDCSTTCGGGSRERTRDCDNGISESFIGCIGSALQAMECNTNKCLRWNNWGNWSACSSSCGGGAQTRARTCDGGNAGQRGCIGPMIEVNLCEEHNCPRWGKWSQWSSCVATCERGTITRTRICEGGQIGDQGCIGTSTVEKECTLPELPACSEWSEWSTIGECSVRCGGGSITKERDCKNGDAVVNTCPGSNSVTVPCNTDKCPEPIWSEWSKWSSCTVSCGGGYSARLRKCELDGEESSKCPGMDIETLKCKTDECPSAKACVSSPCKNAGSCIDVQNDLGAPDYVCGCPVGYSGKDCSQASTRRICHTGVSSRATLASPSSPMLPTTCMADDDACMIATVSAHQNGEAVYVDTAQCAKASVCEALTCDDLKANMKNYEVSSCKIMCCDEDYCNNAPLDMPEHSTPQPLTTVTPRKPKPVTKKPTTKPKTAKPKPSRKPVTTKKPPRSEPTKKPTPSGAFWSEWQSWQRCTHSCGNAGTRQRFRFCMKGAPGMPGCSPSTDMAGKEPCNVGISCTAWREWANWQSCSRSCGGGKQERRRTCDGGAPNTPGCMGADLENRVCNEHSCETTTEATTEPKTTPTSPDTPRTATVAPISPAKKGPRWGEWTDWETCTVTCGGGTQKRSRKCQGGRVGRRGCRGPMTDEQPCNAMECVTTQATTTVGFVPKKPQFSEWTEWGECSSTCDEGKSTRKRECIGGKVGRRGCRGKVVEGQTCNVKSCDVDVIVPEVECMERNGREARRRGRRCPPACTDNGNCDSGKTCECDGLCGKTCQDTTRKCIDILGSIPGGTKVQCSNGIHVGSKCTFSCDDGYKLVGNPHVFCQGTTKWTNQRALPKCEGVASPTTETEKEEPKKCKFKYKSHNACCGKESFNTEKAKCCKGKAKKATKQMTECCHTEPYNPSKMGCCGEQLFKLANKKCQDGTVVNK